MAATDVQLQRILVCSHRFGGICIALVLSAISVFTVSGEDGIQAPPKIAKFGIDGAERVLMEAIVPDFVITNVTPDNAFSALIKMLRDTRKPDCARLNIVIVSQPVAIASESKRSVSLSLTNVPFGVALDILAKATRFSVRVDDSGQIVLLEDALLDIPRVAVRRVFGDLAGEMARNDQEVNDYIDVSEWFIRRGVAWGDEARATLSKRNGIVFLRNRSSELLLMNALLDLVERGCQIAPASGHHPK
jgi:hypothetical protein